MKNILTIALLCLSSNAVNAQTCVTITASVPPLPVPCRPYSISLILQDAWCTTMLYPVGLGTYCIPLGGAPPSFTDIIGAEIQTTMETDWCDPIPENNFATFQVGLPIPGCYTPPLRTAEATWNCTDCQVGAVWTSFGSTANLLIH